MPYPILIVISSIVFALGVIGAQLSRALVLGGGYAGSRSFSLDPNPSEVYPHWLVTAVSVGQLSVGAWLMFRSGD